MSFLLETGKCAYRVCIYSTVESVAVNHAFMLQLNALDHQHAKTKGGVWNISSCTKKVSNFIYENMRVHLMFSMHVS